MVLTYNKYVRCFAIDFFTTPDVYGEMKYREIGLPNAIYFPFGCNESISRKLDTQKKYDVSFVVIEHCNKSSPDGRRSCCSKSCCFQHRFAHLQAGEDEKPTENAMQKNYTLLSFDVSENSIQLHISLNRLLTLVP